MNTDRSKRDFVVGCFGACCLFMAAAIVIHLVSPTDNKIHIAYESRPDMELSEDVDWEDTTPGVEAERSGHWPTVRDHFLRNEYHDDASGKWVKYDDNLDRGCCRCCGSRQNLNVHHIQPFHIDPSLECNPNNFVTLCRDHHFHVGHKDNWKNSNPNVCKDCDLMRSKLNPNRR